jgi:hypothetical protein
MSVRCSETGWELPHYIPFDATKLIVNESLKQWRAPTIACFETVYETLRDVVEDLMQLNFGHFKLLAALIRYNPVFVPWHGLCVLTVFAGFQLLYAA